MKFIRDPLIHIIVLNNKLYEDTLDCLASLSHADYRNLKVILLDTRRSDESTQEVHEKYPEVQVVPLVRNLGYAANNNVGIKLALEQGADWVFILNDDTVLDPACLTLLIEAGKCDSKIGILGPMVYHFDEPDIIQSAGGMLGRYWESIHLGKNEKDRGQFTDNGAVDWVSGCAILLRRTLLEQVGFLDADYFLYWEETEFCIRAAKAGWKIIQVPNAKLWHKGVRRDYQPEPYVTYYTTRNRMYTLAKHDAPMSVRARAYVETVRTLLSWSVKPRWRHKRAHRNAMWKGLIDFLQGHIGPMPS